MEPGLEGKVAVIAGASKGVGRATPLQMEREGATLAFCVRSVDTIRESTTGVPRFHHSQGGAQPPLEVPLQVLRTGLDLHEHVHPAFVFPPDRARMIEEAGATDGLSPSESFLRLAVDIGYVPSLARMGTSDDCASLITWVCSEANGYVTGIEAAVDEELDVA